MRQGQRKDVMALVPGKTLSFPGYTSEDPADTAKEQKPSFWLQRLLDLRIKTMANQAPPSAFNWSAISVAILVVSLIAGGAWYLGYQARAIEQLQKDIDATRTTANQAKDLSLDNKSQEEEALPEPTPKEAKRK